METFKVYPELAAAALRQGNDRCLRLWTIARSFDSCGWGQVRVADLNNYIATLRGVRGLSVDYVRRLLRRGDGVFWTLYTRDGERWLELHGLARVASALGIEWLRRWPVVVGVGLLKTLKRWRGAILASQFPKSFGWSNPISRTVLQERLGYGERTQRNWQKAVGSRTIKARHNAAVVDWRDLDNLPPNTYVTRLAGDLVVLRYLPNCYRSNLKSGRRGMLRHVNTVLGNNAPVCGGGVKRSRLFYGDGKRQAKAVARRVNDCIEGDTFYEAGAEISRKRRKRTKHGVYLWGIHSIHNRTVHYG